jgi:hypothetical protein
VRIRTFRRAGGSLPRLERKQPALGAGTIADDRGARHDELESVLLDDEPLICEEQSDRASRGGPSMRVVVPHPPLGVRRRREHTAARTEHPARHPDDPDRVCYMLEHVLKITPSTLRSSTGSGSSRCGAPPADLTREK